MLIHMLAQLRELCFAAKTVDTWNIKKISVQVQIIANSRCPPMWYLLAIGENAMG
jgi:hypothetical protein